MIRLSPAQDDAYQLISARYAVWLDLSSALLQAIASHGHELPNEARATVSGLVDLFDSPIPSYPKCQHDDGCQQLAIWAHPRASTRLCLEHALNNQIAGFEVIPAPTDPPGCPRTDDRQGGRYPDTPPDPTPTPAQPDRRPETIQQHPTCAEGHPFCHSCGRCHRCLGLPDRECFPPRQGG